MRCEANTGELFCRAHYSNRLKPPSATAVRVPAAAWAPWRRGAVSLPIGKTPAMSLGNRTLCVSCRKSGGRGWMERSIFKDGLC